MRPHDGPKQHRATEAAARTYLRAHLGWLRGFPLALNSDLAPRWMVIPGMGNAAKPEEIGVTRERIRLTEFGRNTARHKFPKTLTRAVGDIDTWTQRTNAQLQILKDVVHDGAAFPDLDNLLEVARVRGSTREAVLNLVKAHKSLTPVVAGMIWIHWHDETALLRSLGLLADHATNLVHIHGRLDKPQQTVAVLKLVEFLDSGVDAAFLDLLADRRCWEVPLFHGGFAEQLKKALKAHRSGNSTARKALSLMFTRPSPQLGQNLVDFICSLDSGGRKVQQKRLRLVRLLIDDHTLTQWDQWWDRVGALEREVKTITSGAPYGRIVREECRALEERIESDLAPPLPIRWKDVLNYTDDFCGKPPSKTFDALVDCLETLRGLPNGRNFVHRFLEQWTWEFQTLRQGWAIIANLLAEQHTLLKNLGSVEPERLSWVCGSLTEDLTETWIGEKHPRRLIRPTLEALRLLIENSEEWDEHVGPFADYTNWDALVAAVALTSDPQLAARTVKTVPSCSGELDGDMWTALFRLSGLCPAKFKAISEGWHSDNWDDDLTKEFSRLVRSSDVSDLFAATLNARDGKRLNRLIARSALNRSLGGADITGPPEILPSEINLSPYPPALHSLLQELARWDRDVDPAADRILSRDFPRAANMEAELDVLRDKERDASPDVRVSLQGRIGNLERRLSASAPACVSERRLENHVRKLERRIRHCRLLSWETRLEEQVRACLKHIDGPSPSERFFDDERSMLLATSFSGLAPGFRDLAFRLAHVRSGPRPWDLRGEPSNRAFLAIMARQGLSLAPWLEGIGSRSHTIGGMVLDFELEDDPLEVMHMGEPFDTCLAPGSFNFFSAVANAADVNKRVLYARDAGGTVRGRCLLALTNDGHILVFNVYAHTHKDAVENAVATFVQDLAQAMGTAVTPRGQVKNLVADDWYDDGPLDLTGQLDFLDPESRFGSTLSTLPPENLVRDLQAELGGRPISSSLVRALVQIRTLKSKPELVIPLLSFIGNIATLDPLSALNIASLARQAGDEETALKLLSSTTRAVSTGEYENSWIQLRFAEQLILLRQPHRALKLLRQTRPSGVRNWESEWDERIMMAARAFEDVYRHAKALALYRIARKRGHCDALACIQKLEQRGTGLE